MEPLSWTTAEFEHKERHPDWLWTAGLVFGLAAAVAFFYGDIFFGIFLVVAGFIVVLFASRKPRDITVTLHEKELTVDETIIDYKIIIQYWIDETQKPDKLLLLVRGGFVPMIALPLHEVTAQSVRAALTARGLLEVPMRESFSARIFERLGF